MCIPGYPGHVCVQFGAFCVHRAPAAQSNHALHRVFTPEVSQGLLGRSGPGLLPVSYLSTGSILGHPLIAGHIWAPVQLLLKDVPFRLGRWMPLSHGLQAPAPPVWPPSFGPPPTLEATAVTASVSWLYHHHFQGSLAALFRQHGLSGNGLYSWGGRGPKVPFPHGPATPPSTASFGPWPQCNPLSELGERSLGKTCLAFQARLRCSGPWE